MAKKKAAPKKASPKKKTASAAAQKTAEQPIKIMGTFAEIAHAFGVTYDTVKRWKRSGMPGSQGNYDYETIDRWVTINGKGIQSTRKRTSKELEDDANEAAAREQIGKADKVEAEAAILNRKNRVEQGGLVYRHDVERFISAFLTELRNLLGRMDVELAAGYGREFEADLREDCENRHNLILNQMYDYMVRTDELEID